MSSREKILEAIQQNQPDKKGLPDISLLESRSQGSLQKFATVLAGIGGKVAYVNNYDEIVAIIRAQYGNGVRIITPLIQLKDLSNENLKDTTVARDLYNVEIAILNAHFGVAENGAVWITEEQMQNRVLPFITQHLAVIINADAIVPTMHQAYDRISSTTYTFGTFIAGPSKTADIEQSLVIGAHGPRSMTVFILMPAKID